MAVFTGLVLLVEILLSVVCSLLPKLESFIVLYWRVAKTLWEIVFFFFSPLFFKGHTQWHVEVPRLGSNRSCCCWPTPEPQPHQIWAASSSTYTTAHSNAWSLTHWLRPGIEPTTSWFLVGFISEAPWQELLWEIIMLTKLMRPVD